MTGNEGDGFSQAESGFDHERLDVYRVAKELVGLVAASLRRGVSRDLKDQVERATSSILLNIAEGAGKTARADKQRFYEIARGSAMETAAQLDVLQIRGFITFNQQQDARALLLRIVKMLSRMVAGPRNT